MWAVLSEPEFSGGDAQARFFATGEGEVSGSLDVGRELGLPERFERALDFGCGLGRLTRALAERFESVVGVDISARMLAAARGLNPIRVLALDEPRVEDVVRRSGGELRRILEDRSVPQLPGRRYFATVAPR